LKTFCILKQTKHGLGCISIAIALATDRIKKEILSTLKLGNHYLLYRSYLSSARTTSL